MVDIFMVGLVGRNTSAACVMKVFRPTILSSRNNCKLFPTDVIQLVEQHVEEEGGGGGGREDTNLLINQARHLLEHLTDHSGLQPTRQVLDLLLAHKVVPPSSLLFSPFIKAHLAKFVSGCIYLFVVYRI